MLETGHCLPLLPSEAVSQFGDVAGILRVCYRAAVMYRDALFLCCLWYSQLMCFNLDLTFLDTEVVSWKGNKVKKIPFEIFLCVLAN